jgi:hypothetical protein
MMHTAWLLLVNLLIGNHCQHSFTTSISAYNYTDTLIPHELYLHRYAQLIPMLSFMLLIQGLFPSARLGRVAVEGT